MQNVMYLIVLFALGALTLIDADECDSFPNITNADFNQIEGCGIIKITCKNGFRMVTSARCIDDKIWWYKKPSCIPDKCLAEPNITNGDLNTEITSRHIDIEYNYTCRPRFRKNGDGGTLKCNASGQWEIDVICEAQCPPDANIPNADLDTNITARCEGSEYNYTCRPAFVQNGNGGTLRCNASGQWEIDVPCRDCFIRRRNLEVQCNGINVPTAADCRQRCASDMNCEAELFVNGREPNCYLCAFPVVGLSFNATFSDCLTECGQLQSCVTVLGVDFNFIQLCALFNDTFEALPSYDQITETPIFITSPPQIFAEKSTCPSLFSGN